MSHPTTHEHDPYEMRLPAIGVLEIMARRVGRTQANRNATCSPPMSSSAEYLYPGEYREVFPTPAFLEFRALSRVLPPLPARERKTRAGATAPGVRDFRGVRTAIQHLAAAMT